MPAVKERHGLVRPRRCLSTLTMRSILDSLYTFLEKGPLEGTANNVLMGRPDNRFATRDHCCVTSLFQRPMDP
jgi:hypothetical protein